LLIHHFIVQRDLRNFTLVGHSFGGGVALVTALMLAEKGEDRVGKLILMDSAATKQPLPFFIRFLWTPVLGKIAISLLPASFLVRKALKLARFGEAQVPPGLVKTYSQALDLPGARRALLETARQIIPPDLDDLVHKYQQLRMPTLLLWGREDRVVPLRHNSRFPAGHPGAVRSPALGGAAGPSHRRHRAVSQKRLGGLVSSLSKDVKSSRRDSVKRFVALRLFPALHAVVDVSRGDRAQRLVV
jgi:pimeloyl-ACP methyl ester carboxylesterase